MKETKGRTKHHTQVKQPEDLKGLRPRFTEEVDNNMTTNAHKDMLNDELRLLKATTPLASHGPISIGTLEMFGKFPWAPFSTDRAVWNQRFPQNTLLWAEFRASVTLQDGIAGE